MSLEWSGFWRLPVSGMGRRLAFTPKVKPYYACGTVNPGTAVRLNAH